MTAAASCRTQALLELVSTLDSGHDAQVWPQSRHIMKLQLQALAQFIQRAETGNAHGACAQQLGCLIEEKLIHQPFANQ